MYYTSRKGKSRASYLWAVLLALVLIGIAIIESRGISIDPLSTTTKQSKTAMNQTLTPISYSVEDSLTNLEQWSAQLLDLKHNEIQWTIRWDMSLDQHNMEPIAQLLY